MNPTLLLLLQSLLVSLQLANAGLATVHANALVALVAGAVIGGLQFFVQNVGNKAVPPPPPSK